MHPFLFEKELILIVDNRFAANNNKNKGNQNKDLVNENVRFPEVLLIFIMAPSMEEVKKRIKERGKESPKQIIERFKSAYREINEIPHYNYVVINDKVINAVDKIEAIIKASKCQVDRIEAINVESEEEILHEFLIGEEFNNKTISEKIMENKK